MKSSKVWTKEEDKILSDWVVTRGEKSWKGVAELIEGKNEK